MADKKKDSAQHDENTPDYQETPRTDTVDPNEQVTPYNAQSPISDEDKDRQNEVLHAQHIEKGFPANHEPRTDEERERMEDQNVL